MSNPSSSPVPYLGFGLGLRIPHYAHILETRPAVDWFEIISENFMDTDGRPKRNLAKFRTLYPIVMHGVAMSIGTADPLNSEYMRKLKALKNELNPAWISDHLCWTGIAHKTTHDLLPVPYTEEALKHITQRIKDVQDFLECPIALENPSTYLEFKSSQMPEAEFIARMATDSGCHLLLDVNNVYVTCYNHRLDAKAYIDALPLNHVAQIHLSGHSNMGTHIIDTHDDHVVDDVWALYKYVMHKAARPINTMIEWDDNIPEFGVVFAELEKAKAAAKDAQNYAPLPDLAAPHAAYRANHVTGLAHSQTHMQDAILNGADDEPAAWIKEKENFSASDQLDVYINGYRYRLYNVTSEDYPVLKYALGTDTFDTMLMDCINKIPATHFNIARYSIHVPEFLASHETATPFALEIAQLESAIAQLMDAPETPPLTPQHLSHLTPEALMESTLAPRKALQLFAFSYPVNDYFQAVKNDQSPPRPEMQNSFLAVYRHEDDVWRLPLEEHEYHLLRNIFSGLTIGDALEKTQNDMALDDEALPLQLTHWFARWMRNGLLASYEDNHIH
ncbi:MAG: DUF692 family protein [Alphaproteobacteria bacterium]|nr:DUF692 family protein [Alphaproteobacteria bacterium]